MGQAYRYVKTLCGVCKKRQECYNWRRIVRNEAIDYGTLRSIANCQNWDPEKKKKEGEI